MLRVAIVLLALANAGYFAWTQGYLAGIGLAPHDPAEPERLQGQINPDMVRLLNGPQLAVPTPAPAAERAVPPPPAAEPAAPPVAPLAPEPAPLPPPAQEAAPALPTACWRATGLGEAQARQLRSALGSLPELRGRWQTAETKTGGRWVVYMGKFSDEMMQRKKAELKELKVDFRELRAPPLSPGLALGTYSSEAAAEQGLRDVTRKGVRSARVAQEREESASHTLTLPAATAPQRAQVQALLGGKSLSACE